MPYKPHERPVKPEHLDRREAKKVIAQAVSRPNKPQHLDRADKGISPSKKSRTGSFIPVMTGCKTGFSNTEVAS